MSYSYACTKPICRAGMISSDTMHQAPTQLPPVIFLTETAVSPKRAWNSAWVLGAGSVKATARKIRPRLIADQSTMFVPGTINTKCRYRIHLVR